MPLAILGVVLALLFEKTKSLWPPIILHAMNNSLAFAYLMSHRTPPSAAPPGSALRRCGRLRRLRAALERR